MPCTIRIIMSGDVCTELIKYDGSSLHYMETHLSTLDANLSHPDQNQSRRHLHLDVSCVVRVLQIRTSYYSGLVLPSE